MNLRFFSLLTVALALWLLDRAAHAQVVINEIHYHPVEDANFDAAGNPIFAGTTTPADFTEDVHEFVEVRNAGAAPVNVGGWKLTGGLTFTFPAGHVIPAGGLAVVAKNPARLAAVYGLNAASILGPYTGQLSNRAETVRLRDSADLAVDSVSYSSEFPWAISADGLGADDRFTLLNSATYRYKGRSLERVSVAASSNDPANWVASPLTPGPSPGAVNSVVRATPKPVVIRYSAAQNSDGALLIRANQQVRLECAFSSTVALSGVEVEYFVDNVNSFTEARSTIAMTELGGGLFVAILPGLADRSVVRFRIKANRGEGVEVVLPRADDPAIVPVAAATREAWNAYFVTPNRTSTKPIYDCFVASTDLTQLNTNITQSPRRVTAETFTGLPREVPYVAPTAPQWNGTKPAIFISNGVVRDAQIRYHGSRYNRSAGRNSFKLLFPDSQKFNDADSTFITDKGDVFIAGQGLYIAAGLPISRVRYVDWYFNSSGVLQRLEQGEYNGDLLAQYHETRQRLNPGSVKEASGEFYKSVGVIQSSAPNGEGPYWMGNEHALTAAGTWSALQRYEWTYGLQNHAWKGAKPIKDFVEGMWAARGDTHTAPNYSGPAHARYAAVRAYMDANVDVDANLTSIALLTWMGPWDDTTQNHFLWRRANGKWVHLPWDFDAMMVSDKTTYSIYVGENGNPSNNFRGPNWFKDTFIKTYRAEYRQRLWELTNSFLDPQNVTALGFGSFASFATSRRTNINSQLAMGTYFKPARPTLQQPANLASVLPPSNFVTSAYSHSNVANPSPHTSTKWEIRPSTGSYDDPAFALTSTANLTTLPIPFDQLVYGQTYFWRVTYYDADGHPSVVSAESRFIFGNSSPTAGSIVINEVLANNRKAIVNGGRFPDYVELKNTTAAAIDIAGWALSDDPLVTTKFVFPAGTSIAAGGYLVVWCDNDLLAPGLHTGFALDSAGQTLTLTQTGVVRDSVTFGPQAVDLSIGRNPDGTGGFALNDVTPNATNSLKTPLGSATNLRVNEWMADTNGDDWFEIYNSDSAPVQIGNLYLSDTSTLPTLTRIPALSFIAGKGFADFIADGSTAGANRCDFRLSTGGDTIILTAANGSTTLALATFGAQQTDVSEGRLPDGGTQIVKFPNSVTRRASNYLPANVVINEALTASTAPLEDAIELFNPTNATVDISGWWLSDDTTNLQKYQIPAGTTLAPAGFKVLHEFLFNPTPGIGNSFSLSSLGDELILSAVDAGGALTGFRSQLRFGGAFDGVSFGRVVTSVGSDFFPQIARTFGEVTDFRSAVGAPNSAPRIGPVVVNEVMYHPPDGAAGTDNPLDEFIELHNITASPVNISGWVLQDAVEFTFPANTSIAAGDFCLVVSFNPADTAALVAFQNRYAVDPARPIFGPYTTRLVNSTANVELAQPGTPIAGETPLIIVDHVVYNDAAPWPLTPDGAGASLQRIDRAAFGNDPVNWAAAVPTPGATNVGNTAGDTDGDGIPNEWEEANGLDPNNFADGALDLDGDGQSNAQEYTAGTLPRDPSSVLRIVITPGAAGAMIVEFTAAAGKSYTVQYRDDLGAGIWTRLSDVAAQPTARPVQVTDPSPPGRRFYRVVTPARP